MSIFAINKDIIELQNQENLKFFFWNFVDIALEANKNIRKV